LLHLTTFLLHHDYLLLHDYDLNLASFRQFTDSKQWIHWLTVTLLSIQAPAAALQIIWTEQSLSVMKCWMHKIAAFESVCFELIALVDFV
jgi:hypothetical protein